MKDTQCAVILAHLKQHGSITPLEALNWYGCHYDLEREYFESVGGFT